LKPKTIKLYDFVDGCAVHISREIARIDGHANGPNLVCLGGMHGNEPTGVLALHRVMRDLRQLQPLLKGNVFALAGNLTALERGERYILDDLNRIWQADRVEKARKRDYQPAEMVHEIEEQIELWSHIDSLMERRKGAFIFVDLHTTSADTIPFIALNDTLMNRRLARRLPVPEVLGIEEYLSEPLLSYVNDLGCPSLAFEAGQHNDPLALRNHEAFLWLILERAGLMSRREIPNYDQHFEQLRSSARGNRKVYEITHSQRIEPADTFEMLPGFINFQPVSNGEILAKQNFEAVLSPQKGRIFMPLYQKIGSEGFFIIRQIAKPWLVISWMFRFLNLYRILPFLPGVRRFMKGSHIMMVNTNIARWYSTEILHLMGYRRKKTSGHTTLYIRRKYDARPKK